MQNNGFHRQGPLHTAWGYIQWLIFYWLVLFIPVNIQAKDFPGLYEQESLRYWATRYPSNITWNLENVILPVLTPQEHKSLRDVELRFPLMPGVGTDPLSFYSSIGNKSKASISIPILSVKFFDDLCIAYSWLWVNGYSTSTIIEYISALKYKPPEEFPYGRYPSPLVALQIPETALDDPVVNDVSQKLLKSAIV